MELPQIAANLQHQSQFPAVLATLVTVEGSSYRRPGARLLVTRDGGIHGEISGGCLEHDLITRAKILLKNDQPYDLVSYDTTGENDLVWGVGTGCHGVVRILLEVLPAPPSWGDAVRAVHIQRQRLVLDSVWASGVPGRTRGTSVVEDESSMPVPAGVFRHELLPPWHLVVFGAGDDARPLVELAAALDWQVTVADPRPDQATAARFPRARAVRCLPCAEAASRILWDDRTVAVVMTHHYVHDLPLLQTLLPLHLPFLGLLGPRQRGERLLADAGFDRADPRTHVLHSPVGLDLGGDGPQAVALSIVAGIQAALHQRDARPLRDRRQPIHQDD